ncbi:MAG: LysM peptidoglycan-binding domain-containing protein [Lentisphaeria bacterium]|nr:LysM peptidoglycan-binding domain-containing protein [Lentisphaeria bacterium]
MNSSKLLRVGMPVFGVCFFAALQSGCQSEALNERPSVPPAEKEMFQEEKDLFNDAKQNKTDDFTVVDNKKSSAAAKDNGKNFEYPVFEETSRTPIYSQPAAKNSKSAAATGAGSVYIVRRGDSLSKIAARHRIKTLDLAKANNLQLNSVIRIGQKLTIPGAKSVSKNTAKKSTYSEVKKNTSARSGLYVVRKGDSISRIAKRCKVKRADLMAANNLNENSILRIGQTLKLPGAKVVNEESVVVDKNEEVVVTPTVDSEEKVAESSKTKISDQESDVLRELGENPAAEKENSTETEKVVESDADKNSGIPTTIQQDMHIDEFCKSYKIDKTLLLKLNPNIGENSVLQKNSVIVMPMN